MKKVVLAVALLSIAGAAQAIEVHGSVGVDSEYVGYGVDQNKGKNASLNAALKANIGSGLYVAGSARQRTSDIKEVVSAGFARKFGGIKFDASLAHAHYDGAASLSKDYNAAIITGNWEGIYATEEHRVGSRDAVASTDYATVGYERKFTKNLTLGLEATERRYHTDGSWKFNDVAFNAKYALSKNVDAVATLAKAHLTEGDDDLHGASSVGIRYKF